MDRSIYWLILTIDPQALVMVVVAAPETRLSAGSEGIQAADPAIRASHQRRQPLQVVVIEGGDEHQLRK